MKRNFLILLMIMYTNLLFSQYQPNYGPSNQWETTVSTTRDLPAVRVKDFCKLFPLRPVNEEPSPSVVNSVPVLAGRVKVLVPATAGTANVISPLVSPFIITLDIYYSPFGFASLIAVIASFHVVVPSIKSSYCI